MDSCAVEIGVGLADDVAAQPVPEPVGLCRDDGRRAHGHDEHEGNDERAHPAARHVRGALPAWRLRGRLRRAVRALPAVQKAWPMLKWIRHRRVSGSPLMSRPGIGLS